MATSAQQFISTPTDVHRPGLRALVAVLAVVLAAALAITAWSAMSSGPSTPPASTGSAQETYDWSASRPGGWMYNAQVPPEAAEDFAALRPGGSVYDSQVPAAALDN
jgi:hypothetical protein